MGIVKSQVLRFNLRDFHHLKALTTRPLFNSLKIRGYNTRKLRKTKLDIWTEYRPRSNNKSPPKALLPIVIPYSSLSTKLVYEWKKLLLDSPLFNGYRVIPAFSRNKNLGELLAPRKNNRPIKSHELQGGSFRCMGPRCKTCKHVNVTSTFNSTYTRRQYKIANRLDCKSCNVVYYLITCNLCNKQYVGQTLRRLCDRLTDHRSNIVTLKDTPIAKHFTLPYHSIANITITPIDTFSAAELSLCRGDIKKLRSKILQKETYWQHQIMTLEPHGINLNNRK